MRLVWGSSINTDGNLRAYCSISDVPNVVQISNLLKWRSSSIGVDPSSVVCWALRKFRLSRPHSDWFQPPKPWYQSTAISGCWAKHAQISRVLTLALWSKPWAPQSGITAFPPMHQIHRSWPINWGLCKPQCELSVKITKWTLRLELVKSALLQSGLQHLVLSPIGKSLIHFLSGGSTGETRRPVI